MSTPNQPNSESEAGAKSLLMLVIKDDYTRLGEGMQTVLEEAHYEVISAESGQQVLDALRACPRLPDLIIMDTWVRGLAGWEIALDIRKQPLWVGIPILFLTALDGSSRQEYANWFGVADNLTKPFDAADLLQAVEYMLKRSR